jgi:hypothetical protein
VSPSLTGYCVRQPDEITRYLRERFGRDYPAWARQQGAWPMRIGLHPPTTVQRSTEPVACHAWADQWRAYTGPGVVEYASARFPTGTHPMPKALVLRHPLDVAAAHPSTALTWQRCGHRLTSLQRTFPQARFTGIIRRITDLDDRDYQRLVNAVTWLRVNPASGMLLRQLPIEGIDTKWLSRHAQLILALLGDSDDSAAPDADQPVTAPGTRRLHERLGLRVPPDLIQVAVLDPSLRTQLAGMRHLAASVEDLNRWEHRPHTVVILENKETGYAITDDYPGTIVLHGQGFSVACYARVGWVRAARTVIYWGDIDAPGLQFVNDLRGHGITINTILMDTATLHRFRHLAADGAGPQRSTLPNLTDTEQELYVYLTEYAATQGTGLLLEQERIPWQYAYRALTTAMNCPRPLRSVTL